MHDTLKRYQDAQFIISTHSPVLLGYPGAQILSFDRAPLGWIEYEETAPLQIVRYFLNNREDFLKELFCGVSSAVRSRKLGGKVEDSRSFDFASFDRFAQDDNYNVNKYKQTR